MSISHNKLNINGKLSVGSNGYIISNSRGGLIVYDGAKSVELPAGSDGTFLAVDSVVCKGLIYRHIDVSDIKNFDVQVSANIDVIENKIHSEAIYGVHGTTSHIVGTDDTQTLTNKIIDADCNKICNLDNNSIKTDGSIDVTKLADGSVANIEFQQLAGVTSNIQGQIDTINTQIANILTVLNPQ